MERIQLLITTKVSSINKIQSYIPYSFFAIFLVSVLLEAYAIENLIAGLRIHWQWFFVSYQYYTTNFYEFNSSDAIIFYANKFLILSSISLVLTLRIRKRSLLNRIYDKLPSKRVNFPSFVRYLLLAVSLGFFSLFLFGASLDLARTTIGIFRFLEKPTILVLGSLGLSKFYEDWYNIGLNAAIGFVGGILLLFVYNLRKGLRQSVFWTAKFASITVIIFEALLILGTNAFLNMQITGFQGRLPIFGSLSNLDCLLIASSLLTLTFLAKS